MGRVGGCRPPLHYCYQIFISHRLFLVQDEIAKVQYLTLTSRCSGLEQFSKPVGSNSGPAVTRESRPVHPIILPWRHHLNGEICRSTERHRCSRARTNTCTTLFPLLPPSSLYQCNYSSSISAATNSRTTRARAQTHGKAGVSLLVGDNF